MADLRSDHVDQKIRVLCEFPSIAVAAAAAVAAVGAEAAASTAAAISLCRMRVFYVLTFKMFWPLATTSCGNLRL